MNRRIELVVVLALGIGIGITFASARGTASAAAKGVQVSTKGKAALIDVPTAPGSVFIAMGQRRGSGASASTAVPLVQVMSPGLTRLCTANLVGPLFVLEMRANLVFDRLHWNECTPQLCVDPWGLHAGEFGRFVVPRFGNEICGNGRDDDADGKVDANDPDCQC